LVEDVRAGFRWILTRRPFMWLVGLGSLANFTIAPLFLLLPLLARDRVAADAAAHRLPVEAVLALANPAGGLAGVLGGAGAGIAGLGKHPRTMAMAVCLAVIGLGEAITGLATRVWALALGMLVAELLIAPLNTASYALWQTLTPPHMLARALSTRRFIAQSAF